MNLDKNMKNKFYITTPIFYVNAAPHIGHAFTMIAADVLARYRRQKGDETFFLTGTDEHGIKISRAAKAANQSEQDFADKFSKTFEDLTDTINISSDEFIRTTSQQIHWPGVVKMWMTLNDAGAIYKGSYEGLYCVGHEAFLKKSDLVDGVCPDHKTKPETIKEENYFFALTKYKKELAKLYNDGTIKIFPGSRTKEVLNMLEDSEDVSFSRPRENLSWGIPVPEDESQTIYVWCDALTNYLSAVGFGRGNEYKKWWPADMHVIGKDILRFHAIIWPAMLLAAGLELPKALNVHGFITVDGDKMSKTVGNVVDPTRLVEKYGSDVVRYFLLREIPSDEDGDFSEKKLVDRYNGDLANGLGNLVQRVATLIESGLDGEVIVKKENILKLDEDTSKFDSAINEFRLHEALNVIWAKIADANALISERKPWEEVKTNPVEFLKTMTTAVLMIEHVNELLKPFMPETSQKISEIFQKDGDAFRIKKGPGLFPRLGA